MTTRISFILLSILLSLTAIPSSAQSRSGKREYTYIQKSPVPAASSPVPADSLAKSPALTDSTTAKKGKGFSFGNVRKWCVDNEVANKLTLSVTLGSGGLGLELSTPITSRARLRTGVEWIPSFNIPLNFELSSFSENGENADVSHIQQMVKDLMGIDMDDKVVMDARPNMVQYKLLADFFPLRNNRHWYVSAGFYIGSPIVGRAKNARGEMQTLVGVNMYNRAYRYFTSPDFDPYLVEIGNGFYLDPELAMEYRDKFERYGSVGVKIGDYKDGSPYIMYPTPEGNVKAKAKTNNFRPYLGIGYTGAVGKSKRLELGFDAGALFWGGAPDVLLHDGVDMTHDLKNIRGKVGTYMKFIKALPVYPLVDFKISYTFF